jgi:hypothetical protein
MVRLPDEVALEELTALGVARPGGAMLDTIVGSILKDPDARLGSVQVAVVDYDFGSISTAALHRVSGTARSRGRTVTWSAFVKTLQHPRHWPHLGTLPPDVATEMLQLFPWQAELETRRQVLPVLPRGLRVPDIYYLDDLGNDRVAVWMEDIDVDPNPWPIETYAHCARLLGLLAARRTPDQPAGFSDLPVGFAVRKLVESRRPVLTAVLADGCMWTDPQVRSLVDPGYYRDLIRLHDGLPALLDEMDLLPQTLAHGDAAPANLLRPRAEPGVFVAIDWSFGSPLPVGHDLGQLLVGDVEGDVVDPAMLPAIHEAILPAYCAGLDAGGLRVPVDAVRRGYVGGLACRTAPFTFPFERLAGPLTEDLVAFLRRRARLGRFLLDLVLS